MIWALDSYGSYFYHYLDLETGEKEKKKEEYAERWLEELQTELAE